MVCLLGQNPTGVSEGEHILDHAVGDGGVRGVWEGALARALG